MSSVEFQHLNVEYARRPVIRDFSMVVPAGSWLGLIGPNGAGKSTLLRSVAGLVKYTGDVIVDGSSLSLRSRSRRASLVAYVPQEPVLPDEMTGWEYVLLGRTPHIGYFGHPTKNDRAMVDDVIGRLGLDDIATRHLGVLSGGERQRLVIARALATEAPILLLDEPTGALDIGHQQQAFELVERLRREHGLTVISAMHDLTLAGMYSDRLALLHEGTVVSHGSVEDVLSAETLAEFYGVRVTVHREADGTVVVIPRREQL